MKKLSVTEQESLKSKLKDVDHDLLSKLLKISNVQLKTVYDNIHVNVITFEGYPEYGFNTYLSKKQAINRIVNLVIENDFSENYTEELFGKTNTLDNLRQKLIKTIKVFLRIQIPGY